MKKRKGLNYKPLRVRGIKKKTRPRTICTSSKYNPMPLTENVKKLQEAAVISGWKVVNTN